MCLSNDSDTSGMKDFNIEAGLSKLTLIQNAKIYRKKVFSMFCCGELFAEMKI